MRPAVAAGERRQWLLLVRQSFGRLMDAALASREVAAEYFVIWSVALLVTPPMFYTVQRTSMYPWIRYRSIEALQQVALADRLFFVIWSMLAAMLLAAVLWDALVPDRTDQQILGVLPVRSRTVAAARLAAALTAALGVLLAIALPSAVLYGVGGAAHHTIGPVPAVFVAHLVVTVLAGLFVFAALLVLRAVLVFTLGARAAGHAALVMQVVTVLLLVQSYMFLPGIVPGLVRVLLDGAHDLSMWPPLWFVAAYTALAGPPLPNAPPAWIAGAATAGVVLLAAASYLLPARANARRTLESRARQASMRSSSIVGWLAMIVPERRARAVLRFIFLSLFRNRRPMLVVATYLGLGLAMAGVRLTSATVRGRPLPTDAPYDYLVAVPLVITYALALGLRSAFASPPDVAANWSFRLMSGTGPAPGTTATRAALMLMAVLPVSALTLAVAAAWWGIGIAAPLGLLHAMSGLVLVEVLTFGCRAIPFTRARDLGPGSLRVAGPVAVLGLHVFAFRLDDLQRASLAAGLPGLAAYLGGVVIFVVALRLYDRVRLRSREVSFEAEEDSGMPQLRLSGSAG